MPRYSPRTGALTVYQPGPYDAQHLYLQWGGKLPGNERWSCGFRMMNMGAGNALDASTRLASYTNVITAFHGNGSVNISSLCKLDSVKLNHIGVDGNYTQETTNETILADLPGAASQSEPKYPNQVALAVTLTTAVTRGPAHKGRFYLPMVSFPITSNGAISEASGDFVSNEVDSLIAAINAVAPTKWKMAVFSRKAGAPTHREVLGNLVGTVYDTQRRRRRSLPENYQ